MGGKNEDDGVREGEEVREKEKGLSTSVSCCSIKWTL